MERFTSLLLDIKYFPRFVPWKWEETLPHLASSAHASPMPDIFTTRSLPVGHSFIQAVTPA